MAIAQSYVKVYLDAMSQKIRLTETTTGYNQVIDCSDLLITWSRSWFSCSLEINSERLSTKVSEFWI
jgi:hypothetical protein